jgi:hypothetical protein
MFPFILSTLLLLAGPPQAASLRLTFSDATPATLPAQPVFITVTGRDRAGRFCRMDRTGQLRPCTPADNTLPRAGRAWADYGIRLGPTPSFDLGGDPRLDSGRIYLSLGEPLLLRVDEASGGLVQPDPGNPDDPNRAIHFDWIELTLDASGCHANTTTVDRFGLPLTLELTGRDDPARRLGPVGLSESRAALLQAFAAEVPEPFRALADPGGRWITAPGHAAGLGGTFDGYLAGLWQRYRTEDLLLTPDEGTFTGRVDPDDRLVFTRPGDPSTYVVEGRPSSAEVFLCNGVLARGNPLERVLGAQLAALINRHLLATPRRWREPEAYYRQDPCNHYARFFHRHGLAGLAYGFPYDDVNDQSPSLYMAHPQEIRIGYRRD